MRRNNLFKKILLSGFWMLLLSTISYAQTVTINQTPGSTTGNGPMGSSTYHISEHIFLQTETGVPTGIPIPIEFVNFYINLPATAFPNTFNNVSIYVRTVTGSVFAASSTYTGTAGYTLLYSGSMTFNAAGFGGVNVTPGTFTYANTAGTNLAFLIIRNNSSGNPGHNFYSSTGNSTNTATTNLTCRRYNSTIAPVVGTTVLSGTGFRTAIQFGKILNNDVSVNQVYTLGKMPIEYGAPTTIQAHVTNTGVGAVTNVPVTLNITGSNSFTDVQTVSLAPGASQVVTFASYSPTSLSTNDQINVSVPADDATYNDTKNWTMQVTPNIYTYKNTAQANSGGVGFNGGTGDFVAKFNSNIGQNYPYNINNPQINEIKVDFTTTGQPYNLGIWDATGPGGTPGTLLYQTASLTTAVGTAIIPIPDVPVSGDYFVGVRQTGTTNVGFAYQAESPIRPSTFYYTSPTGTTTWTDFLVTNSAFRFAIEVSVHIPVPPNCAINLTPADGLTLLCDNPQLSWGNGGGGPTGYDVYLSTNQADVASLNPIALVSANQAGTTYTPTLASSTTYYWTVIPKNSDGDATGCSVSTFTTGVLTNCYCAPVYGTQCNGTITNVSVGTINNTTSTCVAPGYNAYPASGSTTTDIYQNTPTTLSVTCDASSIISVWIDYNHDGNFDASEWNQVDLASTANTASNFTLNIPNTSFTGLTAMRIRSRFATNVNGAIDACTTMGSGESEDYVINILPEPPCTGTPNPGNTVASSSLVCNGSTVNLSLQNATGGTGVSYQWYSADDAAFSTNVQTLGTASTQTATVTANTYYRCVVTCSGSGQIGTSTEVLVNVNNDGCTCTTYCTPTTPDACDEFITNVTFAGINQTSGCNYPYVFFSQTGSVTAGNSYPFTYNVTPFYTSDQVSVFFDWNHDGDFDDIDETYVTDNLQNGSANINVPSTAVPGNTRMRVRLAWAQAPTPCGANSFSDAEDYCVTVAPPSSSTLSLTMFLQGYYIGSGTMQPVLNNQGMPNPTTDCDDVTVELHDAASPYGLAHTFSGILPTNGTISCTFPASVIGNSYYIVVLQRNHVQTWSANPVTMAASTSYNFSTGQNQAYGSPDGNQTEVEAGVWAFYAGDVNQDLTIDGFDYIDMDPNIVNGDCGYYATDITGDGCVDVFDFLVTSPNIDAGITIQAP